MPQLDVSFILDDEMLADCFSVRRRLNVMGKNGRVTAEGDQYFKEEFGVVTQQDPADLLRTEDGQTITRRIFVASRFQFIAATQGNPGNQPDVIEWNGVEYTVSESLPYSRFGEGFYECIAEYRNAIPPLQ